MLTKAKGKQKQIASSTGDGFSMCAHLDVCERVVRSTNSTTRTVWLSLAVPERTKIPCERLPVLYHCTSNMDNIVGTYEVVTFHQFSPLLARECSTTGREAPKAEEESERPAQSNVKPKLAPCLKKHRLATMVGL